MDTCKKSNRSEDLMSELAGLLEAIIKSQGQLGKTLTCELRIVLEVKGQPSDNDLLQALVNEFHFDMQLGPLFGGFGDQPKGVGQGLERFRLLRIPGVALSDLPGPPFPLAYAIADTLGLVSAEPDLETDFFPDGPLREEGLEFFGGSLTDCWAPDADDPTHGGLDNMYWALDKIKARAAWEYSETNGGQASYGQGVRVYQPDTGVSEHQELEPGMLRRDIGWNFVEQQADPLDPLQGGHNPGHGTGTASVVASRVAGRMAGSAPKAELVPVRCITSVVRFNQSPVAAAVDFARRSGGHVITMSLGGVWSAALHEALRTAIAQNVIVVAAAGNCWPSVVWPARYDEVIAVGGTNIKDEAWRGSSRGPEVDICAPAEFVPRACRNTPSAPKDLVTGGQGTSFAVALVAGVAALWLAHHGRDKLIASLAPGETLQDRFKRLHQATAQPLPLLPPGCFGSGLVDAEALLRADLGTPVAGDHLEMVAAATDRFKSLKTIVAPEAAEEHLEALPTKAAFDWAKYGLEIAWLALAKSRGGSLEGAGVVVPGLEAAVIPQSPASEDLRQAVRSTDNASLEKILA